MLKDSEEFGACRDTQGREQTILHIVRSNPVPSRILPRPPPQHMQRRHPSAHVGIAVADVGHASVAAGAHSQQLAGHAIVAVADGVRHAPDLGPERGRRRGSGGGREGGKEGGGMGVRRGRTHEGRGLRTGRPWAVRLLAPGYYTATSHMRMAGCRDGELVNGARPAGEWTDV